MTTNRNVTYRMSEEQLKGLQEVWERDGIKPSEQVRRAVDMWLKSKGIAPRKADGPRVSRQRRSK